MLRFFLRTTNELKLVFFFVTFKNKKYCPHLMTMGDTSFVQQCHPFSFYKKWVDIIREKTDNICGQL
jgi:hypothetical protein